MSVSQPLPEQNTITVRARMICLLAATVLAVTAGFFLMQRTLTAQLDTLVRERVTETTRVLRKVLELRASTASIHADDYTRWDEFVAFARKPTAAWGKLYLTENLATFALDVAWVFDTGHRLIFTANPAADPDLASCPVPAETLASALTRRPVQHFYARTPRGLLELWTSSIQPSSDLARKAPAAGYYVVGRLWTPERIADLSTLLEGTVALTLDPKRGTDASASSRTGEIRVALPFADVEGRQVAVLDYTTTYVAATGVHAALNMFLLLMIGGALLLFIVVSLALTRWVAHPLALVTASLRTENPYLLTGSIFRNDEFGRLARLVRDFFEQRGHLIEAREATEAAARAKQQFLANISHELRTPMNGIISYSRFGAVDAEKAPREELLDYFKEISSCGATLLALLDDLLDLAKFDSGRMRLELEELALGDVARKAVAEFAMYYKEHELGLEVQVEPGLPPVRGDATRLRQVFRNLLSNAAKFTPPGGRIALRVSRAGTSARVTVEDPGKGIPREELESVFDRFSQASNNRGGSGGTGLGLPLCREIVQLHGGRIWAENRAPQGTRMSFELPFQGPAEGSRSSSPTPLPEGERDAA